MILYTLSFYTIIAINRYASLITTYHSVKVLTVCKNVTFSAKLKMNSKTFYLSGCMWMSQKERKTEKDLPWVLTCSVYVFAACSVCQVSWKAMRCAGLFLQPWEQLLRGGGSGGTASLSQRRTLKPTAGPLTAGKKALIWISLSLVFL